MFIVTPYFFLKLVQKLRKKSLHFSELLFDSSKTNSCQLSYLKQNFWLAPNVTNAQKRLLRYPQPCTLVPRVIFFFKKKDLLLSSSTAKRCARDDAARLWSRYPEIIILM